MLRWFRSLFAWRTVRETWAFVFVENAVTGARDVHFKARGVPLTLGDGAWLDGGSFDYVPATPPPPCGE